MTELAPETTEQELARYKRHLKSEQDSARKLMERFCKAMGHFKGCWDNEVERRLKEKSDGKQGFRPNRV